jgi:hypothetical protein
MDAQPAERWVSHDVSNEPPIAATMTWHIHIPIAPVMRNVLHLKLSRKRTAGRVKTIWKIPVAPVARRSVVTDVNRRLQRSVEHIKALH